MNDPRHAYDTVAEAYTAKFADELASKPLDRALLDYVSELVHTADPAPGSGIVGDVGCGPGHVTHHFHTRGNAVVGIDLAPRMIEIATERHPHLSFQVGDMLRLPAADGEWAAVVAYHSIIHFSPDRLPDLLAEFGRVLRPGGVLLLSFQIGGESRHLDAFLDQKVSLDLHLYERASVEKDLAAAGFVTDTYLERAPAPDERPINAGYIVARRMT